MLKIVCLCLILKNAKSARDVILLLQNTSGGWDNLPTSIGKKCVNGYLAPLTYILNICIRQGVFHRKLILARVIPIYKSSSKQSISYYRPISTLTFISKVFVNYK